MFQGKSPVPPIPWVLTDAEKKLLDYLQDSCYIVSKKKVRNSLLITYTIEDMIDYVDQNYDHKISKSDARELLIMLENGIDMEELMEEIGFADEILGIVNSQA